MAEGIQLIDKRIKPLRFSPPFLLFNPPPNVAYFQTPTLFYAPDFHSSQMAPPRGNPRGQQGSARGRGGGIQAQTRGQTRPAPNIPTHVETIGEKRTGYGTAGRTISITTNHFACQIPESIIHHYDGNDLPISSFTLPRSNPSFPSFL